MAGKRIELDESFCEGIGLCARICAEVFRVDAVRSKAVVLQPVVSDPALIEKVIEAENTCPTRAITLTDDHD
jgi:ferredoxin